MLKKWRVQAHSPLFMPFKKKVFAWGSTRPKSLVWILIETPCIFNFFGVPRKKLYQTQRDWYGLRRTITFCFLCFFLLSAVNPLADSRDESLVVRTPVGAGFLTTNDLSLLADSR